MRIISEGDNVKLHAKTEQHLEGIISLASAIIDAAATDYCKLFPRSAVSQQDFIYQDQRQFAPKRRSIIRNLTKSAVRSIIEEEVITSEFNRRLRQQMREEDIPEDWIYV
jgi:hypothetical protein